MTKRAECEEINLRLTGKRGEDLLLTRLEAWAKHRGVALTSAARIIILRGLESEQKHG
jgi:hypothetical protein